MLKKVILFFIILAIGINPLYSKTDNADESYLKEKKHFAIMNPISERIAEGILKKAIKKETKSKFKVKITGYTTTSLKKGVFKSMEIKGKNVKIEDIDIPYVYMQTLTDYNKVDYTQDPIKFETDMKLQYAIHLSEDSINQALKNEEYLDVIRKVNKKAYPLFTINSVKTRITDNKVYIMMDYGIPLNPNKKSKLFIISSSFKVVDGVIRATNVSIDSKYGTIPIDKVTNLINMLDPLSFTLKLMENKNCDGTIENLEIVDNIIQVNGKIFISGD